MLATEFIFTWVWALGFSSREMCARTASKCEHSWSFCYFKKTLRASGQHEGLWSPEWGSTILCLSAHLMFRFIYCYLFILSTECNVSLNQNHDGKSANYLLYLARFTFIIKSPPLQMRIFILKRFIDDTLCYVCFSLDSSTKDVTTDYSSFNVEMLQKCFPFIICYCGLSNLLWTFEH